MKEKFARLVVKARLPLLILCIALAALSATNIGRTKINYDLSKYLGEDTMTKRSLAVMEKEFGLSANLRLMFIGCDAAVFSEQLAGLQQMPGVAQVIFDEKTGIKEKDGIEYRLVTLFLGEGDGIALVKALRARFDGVCEAVIANGAASTLEIQERVAQQIPLALAAAVLIALLVLLIASHTWLDPLLILTTLAVSILINMGTNFIFSSVSFVTNAVCAILQLALSMDYAIMLLNGYQEQRSEGLEVRDAVIQSIVRSLMPILSSALTTIAGLMSLAFMSFSIGIDIGIVLSKGVLISLLTVFLVMPGLIILGSGGLERTRHKPVRLPGAPLAKAAYRMRRLLPLIMLLVIGAAFYLQLDNEYLFKDLTENSATKIDSVFGKSSTLAVLVPLDETDEGYARQTELVNRVMAIRENGQAVVSSVSAMVTTGAQALEYYSAQQIADQFSVSKSLVDILFKRNGWKGSVRADQLLSTVGPLMSENETVAALYAKLNAAKAAFNGTSHARLVFDLNIETGAAANDAIDRLLAIGRDLYGDDFGVTGDLMSSYDISGAFGSDLLKVNLITALAILLIVFISFRSFKTAVLLVAVIEGAIWITMACSRLLGEPIFFMAYLICVAIQMGATIDYAILLTTHYKRLKETLAPGDALCRAMDLALPTILTSGTIFIGAGCAVALLCTIYVISAVGGMVSRGALISVVMVLTLLPALLSLLDGKDKRPSP